MTKLYGLAHVRQNGEHTSRRGCYWSMLLLLLDEFNFARGSWLRFRPRLHCVCPFAPPASFTPVGFISFSPPNTQSSKQRRESQEAGRRHKPGPTGPFHRPKALAHPVERQGAIGFRSRGGHKLNWPTTPPQPWLEAGTAFGQLALLEQSWTLQHVARRLAQAGAAWRRQRRQPCCRRTTRPSLGAA